MDQSSLQLIGTILIPLVAIALSLILYLKQRQKKSLEYVVQTSIPIISPPVKEKFELLFEGNPVDAVQLMTIRIVNTGNLPILPNDYHEHIGIEFAADSRVLSAEITKTFPDKLKVSATESTNRITLQPVLLNGGDWFTVKALIASYKPEITINGRISGVKQICRHVNPAERLAGIVAPGILCLPVGFVLSFFDRTQGAGALIFLGGILWALSVATYSLYRRKIEARLFT